MCVLSDLGVQWLADMQLRHKLFLGRWNAAWNSRLHQRLPLLSFVLLLRLCTAGKKLQLQLLY